MLSACSESSGLKVCSCLSRNHSYVKAGNGINNKMFYCLPKQCMCNDGSIKKIKLWVGKMEVYVLHYSCIHYFTLFRDWIYYRFVIMRTWCGYVLANRHNFVLVTGNGQNLQAKNMASKNIVVNWKFAAPFTFERIHNCVPKMCKCHAQTGLRKAKKRGNYNGLAIYWFSVVSIHFSWCVSQCNGELGASLPMAYPTGSRNPSRES